MKIRQQRQPWWSKYYGYWWLAGVWLVAVVCFWQLGSVPVNKWDEARHGVNAYEMLQRGDYVANYYNGQLDYYNLKPPLSYYLVMLGYQIFGYNAWGLRCLSALCGVLLAVLLSVYLGKKYNRLASLLVFPLLAGCYLYLAVHCFRSGDPDALFMLLWGIAYVTLLLSSDNRNWLHLTGLAVALAFLTKSYHALILLPIIFLYLLFTGGFRKIKWWQYLTVLAVTVAPVALWAGARYAVDGTKFFHDMLYVDVLDRSTTVMEEHVGFPFFYLLLTMANVVNVIAMVLLLLNLIKKFRRREAWDNLDKATLIAWFCVWLLYAVPRSKLLWYIYPAGIPLLIYAAVRLSQGLPAVNWHRAWKIVCLVVLGGSVLASLIYVNVPYHRNELQDVINTMPVTAGATYYYQDGNADQLDQASLLVFEWRTGERVAKGGVAEFQQAEQAYLLVRKGTDWAPDFATKMVVDSTNYVVYYRGNQ